MRLTGIKKWRKV